MSELVVGSIAGLAANNYVVEVASGSQLTQPGMVLQVVSVSYTTAFTTSSTSYVDTGLTATITPSSATSKILVITNQQGVAQDDLNSSPAEQFVVLVRDATDIYVTKSAILTRASTAGEQAPISGGMVYLDSPATTSAVTYKTRAKTTSGGTLYFQFGGNNSSITLLEIAG